MIIQRDQYVNDLLSKRWNGKVKIITGIRRCGKSFLLSTLYKDYLLKEGVEKDCFIELALDKKAHVKYRNPNELYDYVLQKTQNTEKRYYVFIDEIQLSYKVKNEDVDESLVPEEDRDMLYTTFYDILNDLMARSNLDIYVTGSNSKMLSKDIVTNFRDRGSEIKVYPLSFKEYYPVSGLEKADALEEYLTYGGMPLAVLEKDETEKRKYLKGLHKRVYIKDIVERYKLKDDEVLDALIDALSSAIGSLTNPHNLANAAGTLMKRNTSDHTIKNYLDYLEDAYLFVSAQRYDIKGKRYLKSEDKYYLVDHSFRFARLGTRNMDYGRVLENIVAIELLRRGYEVYVGVLYKKEIDFVALKQGEKHYIQVANDISEPKTFEREVKPLLAIKDAYPKMIIARTYQPEYQYEGIRIIDAAEWLNDLAPQN